MEGDRLYRVVNFRYFLRRWDPETHLQLRTIKYRDRFVILCNFYVSRR